MRSSMSPPPTSLRRSWPRTEAPRKLVVLDLDNTLWGGVVGDVGWQDIRLGGHDAVGEAFVAFQEALKALTRRGILLGLASKNEESVALEAIDRHESMVLRRADLAGWRVNWSDKAANIAALAADLNLGLQSVVFIDDNPHERERGPRGPPRGPRAGLAGRPVRIRAGAAVADLLRHGQRDRGGPRPHGAVRHRGAADRAAATRSARSRIGSATSRSSSRPIPSVRRTCPGRLNCSTRRTR